MKGFDDLLFEQNIVDEFVRLLGEGSVLQNEPMSKHTSFKVGGPADLLLTPTSETMFFELITLLKRLDIQYIIIGKGSNLLVRDGGIRGVVIKISNNMNDITIEGDTITAEAGVSLSKLANSALSSGLTGLEFASGIPGTLGGAVYMNAGAYGGTLSDVVVETKFYDCTKGIIRSIKGKEHDFGYRHSVFQGDCKHMILKVKMQLKQGDRENIKAVMDDLNSRRKDKQPLEFPSGGSTFKRPESNYASKLIEEAGLKGLSCGGAMVSEKHSGFIINADNATAKDVLNLIDEVKERVYKNSGILLKEEIRILGTD